ncbi:MAG: T9SS type A sorting domain-containing protein [Candidatus Eisenbacteria bacterium]
MGRGWSTTTSRRLATAPTGRSYGRSAIRDRETTEGTADVVASQLVSPALRAWAAPNPFTASTSIDFVLREARPVEVDLYDATGRRVRAVDAGTLAAGEHRIDLPGSGLPAGVYLYRVQAGSERESGRLVHRAPSARQAPQEAPPFEPSRSRRRPGRRLHLRRQRQTCTYLTSTRRRAPSSKISWCQRADRPEHCGPGLRSAHDARPLPRAK